MKPGWEVKALGEVCTFQRGLTYAKTDEVDSSSNRVLRANNIDRDTGRLIFSEIKYISDDVVVPQSRKIRRDCLLICTASGSKSHLGKVALIDTDEDFAFGGFMGMLIPSEAVIPKFLYWFTRSTEYSEFIGALTDGANINNLRFNQLAEAPFPLPPLDEQKRIVEVLDAAFEGLSRARAHTETNLQNARELFESITREAFEGDGATVTLEEVADIPSALVDPREDAFADLPHVGAGNMETGSDQLVNVMTAREEKLISGKYTFDSSMVLYSKIRPYLRKAARPDFEGLCSADVYPLRPNPSRLDRNYLFHLLMGPDFTDYAISGSGRVGMPKVNRNHLFAYTFSLPSLAEQREATAKIDAAMEHCDQAASHYRAKLADLDALRQALLQKAFAGELT